MQVEVDIKYMQAIFGGRDIFGSKISLLFKLGQISLSDHGNGGQKIELAQKIHAKRLRQKPIFMGMAISISGHFAFRNSQISLSNHGLL